MAVGLLNPVMIVSVNPAGSVAGLTAIGKQKSINEAVNRSCQPLNRRALRERIAGTPSARENFMANSKQENFKAEECRQAAIGAGY
jgi:hypothetical protein